MTATMVDTAPPTQTSTPTHGRPPSTARLVAIETRKAVDTRAGRWLLAVVGLIAVGITLIVTFAGSASDHNFVDISSAVAGFVSFLLPVVGILLVTSEWSQRTAMVTFALVPRRSRIILAKLIAGTLVAVVTAVVVAGVAAVGTAIGGHAGESAGTVWHGAGQVLLLSILFQVLGMLGGMAFGLVFLNSALAIVLSYVVTIAWTTLANAVSALRGVRDWLDTGTTYSHLLDNSMSAQHWAQVGTSAGVWVVALMVIGLVRLSRKEIS